MFDRLAGERPSFYSLALLLSIMPLIKFLIFYTSIFSTSLALFFTKQLLLFLPFNLKGLYDLIDSSSSSIPSIFKSKLLSRNISMLSILTTGSDSITLFSLIKCLFFSTMGWNGSIDYSFLIYRSFFCIYWCYFSFFFYCLS